MSPLLEMQNPACSRSLHEVPFGARRAALTGHEDGFPDFD
jgi:hypothetical protein